MENPVSKIFHACVAVALLAGCKSADSNDSKVNVPTRVALLSSQPKTSYTVVGRVAANRIWQDEFQRQGATSGADAVIVDMASLDNINAVLITGTAIRYKRESAPPSQ